MKTQEERDPVSNNWWTGYVYLIKCNSFYKIGYSKRSAKYRLSDLQIGNPHKLKLVKQTYCKNASLEEKKLHSYFAEKRRIGEWFKLNKQDLIVFDNIITAYE